MGGTAAKQRMGPRLTHAVPSDLGDCERRAVDGRRKARHASRDNSKAAGVVLLASIEQHLDPDADAEEGLAGTGDVVAQDLVEFQRAQVTHCRARRAYAGQDCAVGGSRALVTVRYLARIAT